MKFEVHIRASAKKKSEVKVFEVRTLTSLMTLKNYLLQS
jgi:hypothetical protein